MKKGQSFNKSYWRKTNDESKVKWDHGGYDSLMQEEKNKEDYPKNSQFKKKKNDNNYFHGKEVF